MRLMVAACAAAMAIGTVHAATGVSDGLPPFAAAYEPATVDERGLWMDADENERQLRDSTLVIREEGLNRYLKDVLCRTVGADRCKGVRIYVVEVPAFNANMAPNGTMQVWTGMLLRVQNE
ncbi:MAG: peptidase, partial [Rhizorhabdus sp.]|nr:peptidase [Rhizorhabdus sp.]